MGNGKAGTVSLDLLNHFLKGQKIVTVGERAPYTHTFTFADPDPAPKRPPRRAFTAYDLGVLALARLRPRTANSHRVDQDAFYRRTTPAETPAPNSSSSKHVLFADSLTP